MIEVPSPVRRICTTLEEAGFETWTVGGAVRDSLRDPHGEAARRSDWDLATRATPSEVQRLFPRTVPLGIDHGTVGVLDRAGTLYEVTTFRRDVSTDGRRAVVSFSDTIDEDLARRDFTINALAWHPIRRELKDPFHGRRDLAEGVLRTVGDPTERFREDFLRVLRGLRFAGQFDLTFESAGWTAVTDAIEGLESLSVERVREELMKVLARSERPSIALELYGRSGALARLYPELERVRRSRPIEREENGVRWRESLRTVDGLPKSRPVVRLAALLSALSPARKEIAATLFRFKYSNAEIDQVVRVVTGLERYPVGEVEESELRRWASATGRDILNDVARLRISRFRAENHDGEVEALSSALARSLRAIRRIARSGVALRVGELAVGGRDLIRMGFKPGPAFKATLNRLLDEVLEDPERNDPDHLLDRIRTGVRSGEFALEGTGSEPDSRNE